ncbi:MAG TPA: hypothetical protein VGR54_09295 [Nitrosopumilaceae archaeon]|nr:hypothetical protein [Nitrosopumilaceae archaeon]
MAKTANYMTLLFAIAMFAIVPSFSSIAFAINQGGSVSHTHATATWNPGLVCGDHKCAAGETPHNPSVVTPVKGIQ